MIDDGEKYIEIIFLFNINLFIIKINIISLKNNMFVLLIILQI